MKRMRKTKLTSILNGRCRQEAPNARRMEFNKFDGWDDRKNVFFVLSRVCALGMK